MSKNPQQQSLVPQGGGQIAKAAQIQRLDGPIASVDTLVSRIQSMQQQAFVCCPFTSLDLIPANYVVSERLVVLDPNPDNRDVYKSSLFFKRQGEVGLAKNGILKILQAAGGTILWSKQVDDGSDPFYVEWSCMIRFRQLDGNFIDYPGSKRVNLRDDSPELRSYMTDGRVNAGQLEGARGNIVSLAETKAILRGARGGLALRQGYLREELLQKPFVCYALVANLDMSDPVTKHMAEAVALGIDLYGERGAAGNLLTAGGGQAQTREAIVGGQPAHEEQTGPQPPPDDPRPPEPEKDIFVCGCPCGHQVQLSEERYAASIGKVGSPRCDACYPGQYFDFEMHKEYGDLCLKDLPGYTPEQAEERRKQLTGGGQQ